MRNIGGYFCFLVAPALRGGVCDTMRVRWGRIRSAERVEAHLLEIEFCEPSFGPMCGRRAI
jgi:hypothetical protein